MPHLRACNDASARRRERADVVETVGEPDPRLAAAATSRAFHRSFFQRSLPCCITSCAKNGSAGAGATLTELPRPSFAQDRNGLGDTSLAGFVGLCSRAAGHVERLVAGRQSVQGAAGSWFGV